jgi:hypothetical protein
VPNPSTSHLAKNIHMTQRANGKGRSHRQLPSCLGTEMPKARERKGGNTTTGFRISQRGKAKMPSLKPFHFSSLQRASSLSVFEGFTATVNGNLLFEVHSKVQPCPFRKQNLQRLKGIRSFNDDITPTIMGTFTPSASTSTNASLISVKCLSQKSLDGKLATAYSLPRKSRSRRPPTCSPSTSNPVLA